MISAVILAGGDSARMGRPKALLKYRGDLFIDKICSDLRASGVDDRVAVLGTAAPLILETWRPRGEKIAVNKRPSDGQLSSLRTGLREISAGSEACMVCLCDQPTVKSGTYAEIIEAWRLNSGKIIIPRVPRPDRKAGEPEFKRGHPIIIPFCFYPLCFSGPLDKGLHWVTHHKGVGIYDLDVSDGGVIRDFDTPGDYAAIE